MGDFLKTLETSCPKVKTAQFAASKIPLRDNSVQVMNLRRRRHPPPPRRVARRTHGSTCFHIISAENIFFSFTLPMSLSVSHIL